MIQPPSFSPFPPFPLFLSFPSLCTTPLPFLSHQVQDEALKAVTCGKQPSTRRDLDVSIWHPDLVLKPASPQEQRPSRLACHKTSDAAKRANSVPQPRPDTAREARTWQCRQMRQHQLAQEFEAKLIVCSAPQLPVATLIQSTPALTSLQAIHSAQVTAQDMVLQRQTDDKATKDARRKKFEQNRAMRRQNRKIRRAQRIANPIQVRPLPEIISEQHGPTVTQTPRLEQERQERGAMVRAQQLAAKQARQQTHRLRLQTEQEGKKAIKDNIARIKDLQEQNASAKRAHRAAREAFDEAVKLAEVENRPPPISFDQPWNSSASAQLRDMLIGNTLLRRATVTEQFGVPPVVSVLATQSSCVSLPPPPASDSPRYIHRQQLGHCTLREVDPSVGVFFFFCIVPRFCLCSYASGALHTYHCVCCFSCVGSTSSPSPFPLHHFFFFAPVNSTQRARGQRYTIDCLTPRRIGHAVLAGLRGARSRNFSGINVGILACATDPPVPHRLDL